jgi:hypothetical protein
VYELAGPTTFERFLVPAVVETPGNVTISRDIQIEGSSGSLSAGYQVLVSDQPEPLSDDEEYAGLTPNATSPVRWLRVTLQNGQLIEHEPGRTNLARRSARSSSSRTARPSPAASTP